MGSTKELVLAIQELWNQSEEEAVQKFSALMKKAIEDTEVKATFGLLKNSANSEGQNVPIYDESFNQ